MRKLSISAVVAMSLAIGACSSQRQQQPQLAASAGCAGLGDVAQSTSAFYEPGQVYAAREVQERQFLARAIQPKRTMGAKLYVHATPGMTEEYLQRALNCHAAHGQAAHPNDPVHPASGEVASVQVESAGDSFEVKVIGKDPKVGSEIWQRSKTFASPSGAVTVEQVARADHRAGAAL